MKIPNFPYRAEVEARLEHLGALGNFIGEFFRWFTKPPFRFKNFVLHFYAIGVKSAPIILLVSFFTGAVFGLQSGYAFRLFNAETMVGATVALSLAREIAPVFAALMTISRVGSAMAAELGTMRVTEQIDALESMAIHPYHYLIVPRVVAGICMLPLLTIIFNIVGFIGSYMVGVHLLDIPAGPFMARMQHYVEPKDLFGGLFKSIIFGFLFTIICSFEGFRTKGGAAGVGRSTTRAVVLASVAILICDYFLTQWILELL